MYNPIKLFPNWISVCKIVPLVYDDTLSYYEMLNKLLIKTNEVIEACNTLGVEVDALKQAVERLNNIVNQFDARITANEQNIAALQDTVNNINSSIDTINTTIENISSQVNDNTTNISYITNNMNTINSTISSMQDAIEELSQEAGGIPEIQGDIDALDTRVSNLEDATFGTVTANPMNINYSYDMRNLDAVDYEIVKISGNFETDDITVNANGKLEFYHGDTYNTCKLVLKNVFSDYDNYIDIDTEVVNFGFLLLRANSYTYYSFSNGMTISQLLTGYSGNEYFKTIKLVRNNNGCFDLEIQQYPQTYYLRITLEFFFISLGQTPMTATMVKDFIGAPSQNLLGIIKKNSKNYDSAIDAINGTLDAMGQQVTNNGIAISNETSNRISGDNNLSDRITRTRSDLETVANELQATQEVRTWYNFNDVFENSNFPPNAAIHYFKCQKVGKVVTMEVAGRGFTTNNDFRFGTFYLGNIREGLKSILGPKDGKEVTCFGVSTATSNSGQNIDVTGANADPNRSPLILSGNTLAIGVLTGSETANPWTWARYTEAVLKPYSLMVNTNSMFFDNAHNAFVIRFTYVTN